MRISNVNIEKPVNFFAKAEKIEMSQIIPNSEFCSYNSHGVFMELENGNKKFVNFCSADYGLIPTSDIFPKLEKELLKMFPNVKSDYQMTEDGRFYVNYTFDDDFTIGKSKGAKMDKMNPVLRIQHSYNSRLQYSAQLGIYRQICENGLWGMDFQQAVNLSHVNGNIDQIIEGTMKATTSMGEEYKNILEQYSTLADKKITDYESRIKEIIEETGFHKSVEADILERVKVENQVNKLQINDWLIYNAFNFQLNHSDKIGMADEQRIKLDKKVFHYISESESLLN